MQICDAATSDFSTHMGLEASYLLVSVHLEDKQRYCDHEKQNHLKSWAEVIVFLFIIFVSHW